MFCKNNRPQPYTNDIPLSAPVPVVARQQLGQFQMCDGGFWSVTGFLGDLNGLTSIVPCFDLLADRRRHTACVGPGQPLTSTVPARGRAGECCQMRP